MDALNITPLSQVPMTTPLSGNQGLCGKRLARFLRVGYQRASGRQRLMREVEGVVIADEREAKVACAVGEPEGSLRAPRVLREARKNPRAGDLDRIVRSDCVKAADLAGEPLRVAEIQCAAAAGERNRLASRDRRVELQRRSPRDFVRSRAGDRPLQVERRRRDLDRSGV